MMNFFSGGGSGGVVFGLDPMAVAIAIFALTYILIMTERFNRAVLALLGGGLMILMGVVAQKDAVSHGIDWNTIGLLTGMMAIVNVTQRSGVFQYLAIWSTKKAKAQPWGIMVLLSLVTAVLSALLDNVTTVLLIVPVTLVICEELEVPVYPFLFAEILFSNIGGTATMIGDPPNILIGSMVDSVSFNDFIVHVAPIIPLIMLATFFPIWAIWGRKLTASPEAQARVLAFSEKDAITDPVLMKKSLSVLGMVLAGFVIGHPFGIEPATIAMTGAALLLFIDNLGKKVEEKSENVHHTFGESEWVTIFFFVGLFIIVFGLEEAGALKIVSDSIIDMTAGAESPQAVAELLGPAILWVSAIFSAIVDNIPFVATMIPTLEQVFTNLAEQGLPLTEELEGAMWWCLSLGACLGGNGSLIGASANLIVAGMAERGGHRIGFLQFMKHAFPLMIGSVLIAWAYLEIRYL